MTLLEAPQVFHGRAEDLAVVVVDLPTRPEPRARGAAAPRRYRGVRNAGFARLAELEQAALEQAAHLGAVDGAPSVGVALTRNLEAFFTEARGILTEQIAELDHCLKQAYGLRPTPEASPAADSLLQGFDRLTSAEKRVFAELSKGKPNKIIAYDLAISEATVKAHVSKILKKLKVHSRNRAIAMFAARPAD